MIAVVDYHKGNLKSVERGLASVGADAHITDDLDVIRAADAIVLPGVGAFTDAAESMRSLGQMDLLRERIQDEVPFLGICLGLHLLFAGGEEHAQVSPTPGMGLLDGVVSAMPKVNEAGQSFKIPHVGWNSVEFDARKSTDDGAKALFDGIDEGEFFYFTHSFAAPPNAAAIAWTTHSVTFPCAVQVGPRAFGVQFHPEKSSDAGAHLLSNFVKLALA